MANYKHTATVSLKAKGATATVEVKKMTDDPKKIGNLEQQRAAYIWERVQGCNSDYTNLAKAAPALIMSNGLMQTLAYYQDKGKDQHKTLSLHLRQWLKHRFPSRFISDAYQDVMQVLFNTPDASFYRQATEESLALLRWIRQFAAAKAGG